MGVISLLSLGSSLWHLETSGVESASTERE